jgi:hypothetical protein
MVRDMVIDAAAEGHCVGMALLKDGWETDYYGNPPLFEIGTKNNGLRHFYGVERRRHVRGVSENGMIDGWRAVDELRWGRG